MAMPKGEPAKLPLTGTEKARLLQGSPMRPVIAEISAIVQLVLSQITTTKGDAGFSAYQIAQKLGFTGSEAEWVASLKGLPGAASTVPGPAGPSAYAVAKAAGFAGTEAQWLASLQGAPGAPLRVEQYTATSNSSAVATYTFSPAFVTAPLVLVRSGWAGDQEIGGGITATTTTGCTAAVKRSRGALLLTTGPFEPAPNTALTVVAIGR